MYLRRGGIMSYSKKLIYKNEQMLLEQTINLYQIPADIYLLFLVDPVKLTNLTQITTENSEKHFNYLLNKLFKVSTIFKTWQNMSLEYKQKLYDLNASNNQEITEAFEDNDENLTINTLNDLSQYRYLINNIVDSVDFIQISLPIGIRSTKQPHYYIINSLMFESEDKKLYIHESAHLEFNKLFLSNPVNRGYWTNIWNLAFEVLRRDEIYIGGKVEGNITEDTVSILKKRLVTKSETDIYVKQQNSILLQQYFDDTSVLDITQELKDKQTKRLGLKQKAEPIEIEVDDKEALERINLVLSKHLVQLKEMLSDDSKINHRFNQDEKKYQQILLKIFPYIFPQYTHFIREFSFKIDGNSKKNRDIPDFLALNTDLSVDIIEIKTPYKQLFAKTQYRKNYVFDREILGLITQTQKYIYNLERNAKTEEKNILKEFSKIKGFDASNIDIASPKALVIVGRSPNESSELSSIEKKEINLSLSILKNRYQDILEFLTYDDIVNRIERIISKSTEQINI